MSARGVSAARPFRAPQLSHGRANARPRLHFDARREGSTTARASSFVFATLAARAVDKPIARARPAEIPRRREADRRTAAPSDSKVISACRPSPRRWRARGARPLGWSLSRVPRKTFAVPRRAAFRVLASATDADAPRPKSGKKPVPPPHFPEAARPAPRSTRGRTWSSSWTSPRTGPPRRRRQDPLHVAQVRQQEGWPLRHPRPDGHRPSSCAWAVTNPARPSPAWTSATPARCVLRGGGLADAARCSTCPCR